MHAADRQFFPLCGARLSGAASDEVTYNAPDVTCEACKRVTEAKRTALSIVDAAHLRALASIIEATGEGLSERSEWDRIGRETLRNEINRRTATQTR